MALVNRPLETIDLSGTKGGILIASRVLIISRKRVSSTAFSWNICYSRRSIRVLRSTECFPKVKGRRENVEVSFSDVTSSKRFAQHHRRNLHRDFRL